MDIKVVRVSKFCFVEDDLVFWCKWCENSRWEYNYIYIENLKKEILYIVYLDSFKVYFLGSFVYFLIYLKCI